MRSRDDRSIADDAPQVLAPPRVNAVGLLETDARRQRPRAYSDRQRWGAWLLLTVFVAATLVTSALTLGAYCLTTDGGDTRAVQERLRHDP